MLERPLLSTWLFPESMLQEKIVQFVTCVPGVTVIDESFLMWAGYCSNK